VILGAGLTNRMDDKYVQPEVIGHAGTFRGVVA